MGKQAMRTAPTRPGKSAVTGTTENSLMTSAPAATVPAAAAPGVVDPAVADADIRMRAYLKWEAAGKPDGRDVFFWTDAERELHLEREAFGQTSMADPPSHGIENRWTKRVPR